MNFNNLQKISKFLRYWSLRMSTKAGSGHPTSSLSAADLMAVLLSGFFRYDFKNPNNPYNDRLIFSKGHATPLYYALFAAVGVLKPEELDDYRKFGSILEGHATPRFPYVEAATGSLGQGLSIGVGMAIALRAKFKEAESGKRKAERKKSSSRFTLHASRYLQPLIFVLLGDGEMAEGSIWEAIEIASKYNLNNLIAILDINRLGQSQETMLGYDVETYKRRIESFGWKTMVIDGHDYGEIAEAFRQVQSSKFKVQSEKKPFAIIAKTIKGKGVSFLENKEGWHGKPIPSDQLDKALTELGKVDLKIRVKVLKPLLSAESGKRKAERKEQTSRLPLHASRYKPGDQIATRKAYGTALARLGDYYPDIVALDGDVKNSTYSEIFKEKYPGRFFEMYIAEQNMVGTAVGFSRLGIIPFVSTFAAFLTRAFDQIRMAAVSQANIKFCGSHAGVSIGEDGPSQMGLEDLAMFRAVHNSIVLYPSDAISTEKLVEQMIKHRGISYLRTTRPTTPVIYENSEKFPIGGCKVHTLNRHSGKRGTSASRIPLGSWTSKDDKKVIIVAAGITLFEALRAQGTLAKEGIEVVIVDCYSVKPIDEKTLKSLVISSINNQQLTISNIITVEDHWFDGGLGDAVLNVFADSPKVKIYKLAVSKMPRSGKPQELLDYEDISSSAIIRKVKEIL